jgi:Ca2+-binding EF-hand superfamily protein
MMRIPTLLMTCAVAGLIVPALAQGRQEGRGGPPPASPIAMALDSDHDGVISAAELEAAPTALKTLDRNADGRIDQTELVPVGFARGGGPEGEGRGGGEPGETPATSPAELASMLMTFDANKDGVLTRVELPERLQPIFDRADTNKDGKLTVEEITRSAAAAAPQSMGRGEREGREGGDRGRGPGGGRGPGDRLLAALDTNHDGMLDAAEIQAARTALRTLDTNQDGRLTPDEYRQMGRIG